MDTLLVKCLRIICAAVACGNLSMGFLLMELGNYGLMTINFVSAFVIFFAIFS